MNLTENLDSLMVRDNIKNKSELSKLTGVPYMTIVNIYKLGYDNIKLNTLRKFARFFKVSLDFLVGEDDNQ